MLRPDRYWLMPILHRPMFSGLALEPTLRISNLGIRSVSPPPEPPRQIRRGLRKAGLPKGSAARPGAPFRPRFARAEFRLAFIYGLTSPPSALEILIACV